MNAALKTRNIPQALYSRLAFKRNCGYSKDRITKATYNEAKVAPTVQAVQTIDEYPEEPTTCCMSGCANCVWLEYAEKLSVYYRDGGERAIKEINERVTDPNIKMFLLQELKTMKKS